MITKFWATISERSSIITRRKFTSKVISDKRLCRPTETAHFSNRFPVGMSLNHPAIKMYLKLNLNTNNAETIRMQKIEIIEKLNAVKVTLLVKLSILIQLLRKPMNSTNKNNQTYAITITKVKYTRQLQNQMVE